MCKLVAQQMLGYPRLEIEVKNRPRFYFFQHENLFPRKWQYGQQNNRNLKRNICCAISCEKIKKFRITLTANGKNYRVTMFISFLPLFFFQFFSKIEYFFCVSMKDQNYFTLLSLPYSFFQENINANLTFAVSAYFGLSQSGPRTE